MPTAPLNIENLLTAEDWANLSSDIRRRFAARHAPVVYRGTLSIRRTWLGAAFALVGALLGQPLPRRAGEDIATEAHVAPNSQGGVVWERWLLTHGHPASRVRSTKQMGRNGLEECTDRGLGMALEVFTENGTLVFQSRYYFLALGRWQLALPGWATPGICRVTHTSYGPNLFRFTLEMRHKLAGVIFTQSGMFIDPVAAPVAAFVAHTTNQPELVEEAVI